jgi:hypothetical protein
LKNEEARKLVTKLFRLSIQQVSSAPRKVGTKTPLFGLSIRAEGADGEPLSVIFRVQKLSAKLAQANGPIESAMYVQLEYQIDEATVAERAMAEALALSLLHHIKPEVRALAKGEHVHISFLPALILASQNQMRLGSRGDDDDFDPLDEDDYFTNENIRIENQANVLHPKPFEERQEVKRQYRGRLNAAVQAQGGVIQRDGVPPAIKQKALDDAKLPDFDYSCSPLMMQYKCNHAMLTSTTELRQKCDEICSVLTDNYYRDQMELCHKWSIKDQNTQGMWGKSHNECGKLVSNRCHEIALCYKPCHRIIDSLLSGEDIHEVVQ